MCVSGESSADYVNLQRLNVGYWNMKSLVEGDVSLETARSKQITRSQMGTVEKSTFVVCELWCSVSSQQQQSQRLNCLEIICMK